MSTNPSSYLAFVTLESLFDGTHRVLDRIDLGRKSVLFVRLSTGAFALVVAGRYPSGDLARIQDVVRISDVHIGEFSESLARARRKYEAI